MLLCILAKPSYAFALLPGCCLFALWRVFRRQRVDWLLLLCGFCIPGSLLMGLLYLLAYASADVESAIRIGVFTFIHHWIPTWRIPIQFLLSLVFPLAVFALYFKRARRNLYLIMCWVIFAVAASCKCLYFVTKMGHVLSSRQFYLGQLQRNLSPDVCLIAVCGASSMRENVTERVPSDFNACSAYYTSAVSWRLPLLIVWVALAVPGIAYYYRFHDAR